MSEKPKTLKFPEFDDFHSTRDYVLAIKKFRKALVTELEKLKQEAFLNGQIVNGHVHVDIEKFFAMIGVKEKKNP